jgi:hyperosmotically inducible periplasmic protein
MKTSRKQIAFGVALTGAALLTLGGCSQQPATNASASSTTIGNVIDDGVVTGRVKTALISDPDVKGFDFKVDTRRGEVQLSGYVDSQAQVDKAISIASAVEGVKGVDNKVTLKTGTETIGNSVDDSVVTAKVKSALIADQSVNGLDIGVKTRKGLVQLSGFVDSTGQAARAAEIARGTEGVQGVTNEISIKQ